jgi:hypothetical protein
MILILNERLNESTRKIYRREGCCPAAGWESPVEEDRGAAGESA